MRCLGVPARSLTNFESAHDTDANLTLDYHYNKDGKPREEEDDSVWLVHTCVMIPLFCTSTRVWLRVYVAL